MSSNLKLGSNWKSCGIGIDMRRWAHGNPRINFGWCKGDDNFGGRQRKELDDFTKSLGKQMNLVMYRMQDTENVRFRLRERKRQEVRDKFEKEEREDKLRMERLERNKKWRQRKEGTEDLEDEEKELDDNEKRKLKNREWRLKRESPEGSIDATMDPLANLPAPRLLDLVLVQLQCDSCQREMGPPVSIVQCSTGHNVCRLCYDEHDVKTCSLCSSEFVGSNSALMKVAQMIFEERFRNLEDGGSIDFRMKQEDEEEQSVDFKEPAFESLKEVKSLEGI